MVAGGRKVGLGCMLGRKPRLLFRLKRDWSGEWTQSIDAGEEKLIIFLLIVNGYQIQMTSGGDLW